MSNAPITEKDREAARRLIYDIQWHDETRVAQAIANARAEGRLAGLREARDYTSAHCKSGCGPMILEHYADEGGSPEIDTDGGDDAPLVPPVVNRVMVKTKRKNDADR